MYSLQLSCAFSPSSTGPGFLAPFLPAGGSPLFLCTGRAGLPSTFRPVSLASYVSGLFQRLILIRLCLYLESKNLVSLAQAYFRPSGSTIDQVLLSQSIWDGFQRRGPRTELFWPPLIFLELLVQSGTQLFVTNYWLWVFRLALFGLFCRRKNRGPLP